jgi:hypothetical protein
MSAHRILLAGIVFAAFLVGSHEPSSAQWAADGAPVCVLGGTQQNVRAAADGSGGAILVWEDARVGAPGLYVQRVNSAGVAQWTLNGRFLVASGSRPRIVSDGTGGAIVVWRDNRAGAIGVYAQRLNASGTEQWTPGGVRLSTTFGEPEIALDGAGGVVVAWFAGAQPTRDIYAQRVSGAGAVLWAAGGLVVCRHPQDQLEVDIAADGTGGAILAWLDYRSGTQRVYARRVGAAGDTLWSAMGNAISPGTVATFDPKLAADGAGGAYVTVPDQRVIGQGTHLYVHRVTSAGATQAGWNANGVDLGICFEVEPDQNVIRDSGGGAIVVQIGGGVHHVTPAGTNDWAVNLVQINSLFDAPIAPVLVSNGAGGAVAGWHDFRTQVNYDTYATMVLANGTLAPGCPQGGEVLSDLGGTQSDVAVCADGQGGAIFAWRDGRTDAGDIYALRTTCTSNVGVEPTPAVTGIMLRPETNPALASRRVVLALPDAGLAVVSVLDLAGRVVARHEVPSAGAGPVTIDVDPERRLTPGLYFVRVEHDGAFVTRKATFLR